MQLLYVFIGGGFGAIARYLIGTGFQRSVASLPLATLLANLTACLILALLIHYNDARAFLSPGLRLLLLTGFCGGLSTFSAFGYETFLLLRQGQLFYGMLNILVNTGLCLLLLGIIIKRA